jgi:type II secretory pathway component PulF
MSEAPTPRAAATGSGPARTVSLDDLIALNDEILALARAGVPLERGLAGLAGDLSGRLARITSRLAERVGRGESLPAAMAQDPQVFPPVYRALVEAGLRAGRLAPVLEGLAASARKLRDVRQTVRLAMLYPVGVALLACGLLVFMLWMVLPKLGLLYDHHPPARLRMLEALGQSAGVWAPCVPVVIGLILAVWWYYSNRTLVLQAPRGGQLLGWMPGVRSVVSASQAAAMSEILALLLEQGVPLGESILLAADTVGDRDTRRAAQALAVAVRSGGLPTADLRGAGGLAPLVRWLIIGGQNERMLIPLVRHTAEVYRGRMLRKADWLRFYLPALLTAGIGGTATLLYGLALFVPLTDMLRDLAG